MHSNFERHLGIFYHVPRATKLAILRLFRLKCQLQSSWVVIKYGRMVLKTWVLSPFGQNFTVEFDPFSPKNFGQAYCTNERVVLERVREPHDMISLLNVKPGNWPYSWRDDQLMMTLSILTLNSQSTVLCSAWKRSKTNTWDPFVEIFGLIHKYYD